MTFASEVDTQNLIINYVNGFAYDSRNRAIERRQLGYTATPANPGQPLKTVFFKYDDDDRMLTEQRDVGFNFNNTTFWPTTVHFDTRAITQYFYYQASANPCSTSTIYYDINRDLMPLSMVASRRYYAATGRLDSILSISKGLDSAGTVYGPRNYSEDRTVWVYDTQDWAYRSMRWFKNLSPDSPSVKSADDACYRREYDGAGNAVKQFSFCDSNEQLSWSRQYNEYNAPTMQEAWELFNPGRSLKTWYFWGLVDLDTAKEHFHD